MTDIPAFPRLVRRAPQHLKLRTYCFVNPDQSFLSIICLPQAIITVNEESIPALENLATEFSGALRFHKLNTSAILYQIKGWFK
ncbi:MAG: hypothetical protein U9R17_04890 [Thermodesulfobacteriota bacterium]|nr:hypothetical protein [Thermodesulfobacteriota bacterium]